ncbi:hypothetical protein, partial [Lysinibacillus sp. FJAT-14222]|uniref:hypothetical protein n=1 Tax=Lysinibacillus sp. FJAT-14222 TaxID=1932366 RepID=UPI0019D71DC5
FCFLSFTLTLSSVAFAFHSVAWTTLSVAQSILSVVLLSILHFGSFFRRSNDSFRRFSLPSFCFLSFTLTLSSVAFAFHSVAWTILSVAQLLLSVTRTALSSINQTTLKKNYTR